MKGKATINFEMVIDVDEPNFEMTARTKIIVNGQEYLREHLQFIGTKEEAYTISPDYPDLHEKFVTAVLKQYSDTFGT